MVRLLLSSSCQPEQTEPVHAVPVEPHSSRCGDAPAAARLRQRAPRYRVDYSRTTQSFYWMNHCEHCDAKLGDFETLQEAGAFENRVELVQIDEPFSASCGSHTL